MRERERELMRHATTTVASGLETALARQYGALARRWTAARDGHVKAVHRARVASRRLREALAVLEDTSRHRLAERVARSVRRVTRALGPVREIDVALIELERASRRHRWADELVGLIHRRLVSQRERRSQRMAAKIAKQDRSKVRNEVRALAVRVSRADDRSSQSALAARIVRRARALLGASAAAGTIYAPERLHALRITIKKLRYALELLPPTPGLDVANVLRVLKRAQGRFGLLHDVQVLMAEVQAIDTAGRRIHERA